MKLVAVIIVAAALAAIFAWAALQKSPATPHEAPLRFSMPIDDAFALKEKGKVVVVGVIDTGKIYPGDALLVKTEDQVIPVTVEALEAFHKPLQSANAGERVGIMLHGVDKEEVKLPATLTDQENGT